MHACLLVPRPTHVDWTAYIKVADDSYIFTGKWSDTILAEPSENFGSLSALRRVLDDERVKNAKSKLREPQLYMRTVNRDWIRLPETVGSFSLWRDSEYLPKHLEFLIANEDGT
eukprot:GHVU01032467.1.p1 GENE.GHVU01032467.1~~GHVU01032467.1.p1  ORF type:complete len:114 (-),score=4.68 GHVU01032467.1:56-397(-)